MKITVFWFVAQCSLAKIYRRFWSAYCLHNQGYWWRQAPLKRRSISTSVHGTWPRLAAMRTWSLTELLVSTI